MYASNINASNSGAAYQPSADASAQPTGTTSTDSSRRASGNPFRRLGETLTHRSAGTAPTSQTRHSAQDLSGALAATRREGAAPDSTGWPEQADMAGFLGIKSSQGRSDSLRLALGRGARLSTMGLQLPPLTPHGLGNWFAAPAGNWPQDRPKLVATMLANLQTLAGVGDPRTRDQLHSEITVHWHCLCEVEKKNLLEKLMVGPNAGLLGNTERAAVNDADRTNVRDWLDHTLLYTDGCDDPDLSARLLAACGSQARDRLKPLLAAVKDDEHGPLLAARFHPLHLRASVTDQFDLIGFIKGTNREYAKLPEDKRDGKIEVLTIGAGPTGLAFADGANRMGAKVEIYDARDRIGGRVDIQYGKRGDGTLTPFPMGAMRVNEDNGIMAFVDKDEHPTAPFGNPGVVLTAFVLGDRVFEQRPGEEPLDDMQRQVRADVKLALGSVLQPILEAREAGNPAKLWTRNLDVEKKFDGHTFRTGLETLLREHGIVWNEDQWKTFGDSGIGVGGYKAYEQTGFLEMFGFRADKRIDDHVYFPKGIEKVFETLLHNDDPLQDGTPVTSLAQQGALHLNTEITHIDDTNKDVNGNPKPVVTFVNKLDGSTWKKAYDHVAFTGGPFEAEKKGFLRLTTASISAAAVRAQGEPATKLGFTVPADRFEELGLPENFQLHNATQQVYVMPRTEGSDVRKVLVYGLGENANRTAEMSDRQMLKLLLNGLRDPGRRGDEISGPQELKTKLTQAADLFEEATRNQDLIYQQWSKADNIHTAFKMDRAGHRENSAKLEKTLTHVQNGVAMGNEMWVRQGGFISGAVQAAATMAGAFAHAFGGTQAPNSAFDHAGPYRGV